MKAYVYILRCRDHTLYTGWTDDLEQRIESHQKGKGAKYTRGRTPVTLVWCEEVADKSLALKREWAIKKLTRRQKEQLIVEYQEEMNVE